ncbi:hypothetical protein Q5P01_021855 [Channa striata]|uniref:Uncharacterized protein n=1 Tax=Channa striata TaxID=64152 RepID=A0AA88LUX2_CHASR|nr:hypothetical protein Q5P01_021855 [Channa striata]
MKSTHHQSAKYKARFSAGALEGHGNHSTGGRPGQLSVQEVEEVLLGLEKTKSLEGVERRKRRRRRKRQSRRCPQIWSC